MSHSFATVFESPKNSLCREMRLVLEAVGFHVRMCAEDQVYRLMVDAHQAERAHAELTAYQDEQRQDLATVQRSPHHRNAEWLGSVLAFAWVITAGSLLGWSSSAGSVLTALGTADAGLVQGGEIWRCVTALTLHADLAHLLSNLLFGTLFLILASRSLGGGVALLTALVGGSLGNLLNASMRDPSHLSLGASTAVFAALGIGVACTLQSNIRFQSGILLQSGVLRRWSPLIAGGVLLAMTGMGGERTDVGAHFTGFAAGLVTGWIACLIPDRWLDRNGYQTLAASVAAALTLAAWAMAIMTGV